MALTANTIPTLVGNAVEEKLRKTLAYNMLFNENWSGQFGPGATLKVPSIGSVSVNDHTRYSDITWEEPSDSSNTLSVDQDKYFAIAMDDADEIESNPQVLAAYAEEAAYQLDDTIDQFLVSTIVGTGSLITSDLGSTGSPITVNSANAGDMLLKMARKLDDAKVPRANRRVVIPPWYMEDLVLAKIDLATNNTSVMENATVGRYAGFEISVSHNVPAVGTGDDEYQIVASYPGAMTWAMELREVERLRLESKFADGVRGRALYGATVTKPGAVALLTAQETSEP
jgi:hypothetical protein